MYVRIVVDNDDVVVGYLTVMAWADDVRFFGTEPEIEKYLVGVRSKVKITLEKPPVTEFVSIETHQDSNRGITELKMPSYWVKALGGIREFLSKGPVVRDVPISEYDEKLLSVDATVDDIAKAKHLPF